MNVVTLNLNVEHMPMCLLEPPSKGVRIVRCWQTHGVWWEEGTSEQV